MLQELLHNGLIVPTSSPFAAPLLLVKKPDDYQVRTNSADVEKTAFRSPLGSFAWKVMGMGLTNAAPTFQRLMDSIFRDLDFVSCYLDDIIIFSKTAEEHFRHLEIVLQRLEQHQLIAREAKCSFFQTEIQFLGFRFSAEGRSVDATKTAAITGLAPPTTVHGLQRWLGMVNYYSSFIPALLTSLLHCLIC